MSGRKEGIEMKTILNTSPYWDLKCEIENENLHLRHEIEAKKSKLQRLEDALEMERQLTSSVRVSEDYTEGVRAFAEKRKPDWKGR